MIMMVVVEVLMIMMMIVMNRFGGPVRPRIVLVISIIMTKRKTKLQGQSSLMHIFGVNDDDDSNVDNIDNVDNGDDDDDNGDGGEC